MFVLKRFSDAVAENDNILGVIRGIEVNQSAHADSITQPHVPTQIDLFNKLVTSTGIEPTKISVIEAHGTGKAIYIASHVNEALTSPPMQARRLVTLPRLGASAQSSPRTAPLRTLCT